MSEVTKEIVILRLREIADRLEAGEIIGVMAVALGKDEGYSLRHISDGRYAALLFADAYIHAVKCQREHILLHTLKLVEEDPANE